jgi:hypothetical protein
MPPSGTQFLGLPALTIVEGSELLPQVPKGETLLSKREEVGLRDPL